MGKRHKNAVSNVPTRELPSIKVYKVQNSIKNTNTVLKSIFMAAFVGLVIYGIFYVWSGSISISKNQPETFTELYFEDARHLPSTVVSKHPYFFQFTLHNLEGKDMEYPYEVYVEAGKNKLIFDKGTILVKENDYKTIQERFATASILPKSKIVVELVSKNQFVDFWIQGSV